MRSPKTMWTTMWLLALWLPVSTRAATICNPVDSETVDLTLQRKGPVVLKGPVDITLAPLNRLRYDVVIGNEVVFGPGPDLSKVTGLIPSVPAAVQTAAASAAPVPPAAAGMTTPQKVKETVESLGPRLRKMALSDVTADSLDYEAALRRFQDELGRRALPGLVAWAESWRDPRGKAVLLPEHVVEHVFTRLQAELSAAEGDLDKVRQDAAAVKRDLEDARDRLLDLVQRSDQLLAAHYPDTRPLIREIRRLVPALNTAVQAPWPNVGAVATHLGQIETELEELPLRLGGFAAWRSLCDPSTGTCNGGRYQSAVADVVELSEGIAAFDRGSDLWMAQDELRTGLSAALPHLKSVRQAGFTKIHRVTCGYPYFQSRTTTLQVVLTDRLEKDKSKATRTVQVAEIACPSHFSVTAGVGVARIDERDIAFVSAPAPPGDDGETNGGEGDDGETNGGDGEDDGADDEAPGLTKVFGFDNRSSEQINPTFLVSTRLCQNRTWDLHLSFGTLLDLDRPDSSAVFGYLGGLTMSVKDSLFMTLGVQAQRVPELTGGFEIGDPVPPDLTEPPVEANWDFGPVLSVTYKMN